MPARSALSGAGHVSDVFRPEALRNLGRSELPRGVLVDTDASMRAISLVLTLLVFALFGAAGFLETNEYVSGQAVVSVSQLDHTRSQTRGVIEDLNVAAGDELVVGQQVARVVPVGAGPDRRAAFEAYEYAVVAMLRAPERDELRDAVRGHRQAITERGSSIFPAPVLASRSGAVVTTRVRNGELVEAGDIVLSSSGGKAGCKAVASFPAHTQIYVRPGARFRVSFAGNSRRYWWFEAERVEEEALREGASRSVDSLTVRDTDRAWVRVYGTLLPRQDEAALHEGMLGTAELVIQRRTILARFLSGFSGDGEQ